MISDEGKSGDDMVLALIGLAALTLLVLSPMLVDTSGPDPYYKGPLIYPQLVLSIIVLASLYPAWRLVRSRAYFHGWTGMPRRSLGVFAVMCFYPLLISAIGLAPASLVVILAGLIFAGRNRGEALIIAVLLATGVWGVFRGVLDIWFPAPWLIELFGV